MEMIKGYEMGQMFVRRHGFGGGRALDIGAGHCAHTVAFADVFDSVDALDITGVRFDKDKLLKLSPSASKINFIVGNAEEYCEGKYDLIYSLSALEHMSDWRRVIKNVSKMTDKFYLVISPLYYSPLGHHLDPEVGEWEHLLLPEKELRLKVKEGLRWKIYEELNRVTAAELLEELQRYFSITYKNISITTMEVLCQR